ncbi:hypothetical protein ACJJTC_016356 [Scirpophaga incertulas]
MRRFLLDPATAADNPSIGEVVGIRNMAKTSAQGVFHTKDFHDFRKRGSHRKTHLNDYVIFNKSNDRNEDRSERMMSELERPPAGVTTNMNEENGKLLSRLHIHV